MANATPLKLASGEITQFGATDTVPNGNVNWAAPGNIGTTTPGTGKFTQLLVPTTDNLSSLLSGTVRGLRWYVSTASAFVEGVDQTGSGSYQPIAIGGSTVTFHLSATSYVVLTTTSMDVRTLLDLSNASAGQIKFPASQNASSNANTLDDYEEGTWTPTDGSGASLSFTAAGTYTKTGRKVTVTGSVIYPATASTANNVIAGLPFICNATYYAVGAVYANIATHPVALVVVNTAALILANGSGGAQYTNTQLQSSSFTFTVTYEV